MRRYWIDKKNIQASSVEFSGDLFHHIFEVCRQERGHHFEVITEDSVAFLVEVTAVEKKRAEAQIIEKRVIAPLPHPWMHLAISLPRFQVMDAVLEKSVEMGVKSVQPLFSDYSFMRKDSSLPQNKLDRWEKIIVSATQQSGRGDLMTLASPQNFADFVKKINLNQGHMCLFAYEGSANSDIKTHLSLYKNKAISDIWVVVGSEGGFSDNEVREMKGLDFQPVTLGPQVLRVETACIALISVLKYEFDLMRL